MTAILILVSLCLGLIFSVLGVLALADVLDKLTGVTQGSCTRLVLREPEPYRQIEQPVRKLIAKPQPFQVVPVKQKPSTSELEVEKLKAEVLFLREQLERKNVYR